MNRKALLIAAVSAALGLVLFMTYQQRFERQVSGGTQVSVLIALQDISAGDTLTESKLGMRDIPSAYLDDRHIRHTELRRIVGVRASTTVKANQSVLWTDLANSDARRDLSSLVGNGRRAVTIRTDATSTFGGLIRPGDLVDVLATIPRSDALQAERITITLLQNMLVLAAGRDTGGELAAARPGSRPGGQSVTDTEQVTLLVSVEDAARLVFAQNRGHLSLILRNPRDNNLLDRLPETSLGSILQAPGTSRAAPTTSQSFPPSLPSSAMRFREPEAVRSRDPDGPRNRETEVRTRSVER